MLKAVLKVGPVGPRIISVLGPVDEMMDLSRRSIASRTNKLSPTNIITMSESYGLS